MTRKISFTVVLVAALVSFLLWRQCDGGKTRARSATPAAPPPETPVPRAHALAITEREIVSAQPVPAVAAAEDHATSATTPEPPDLAARDWLEILVLDLEGRPVFDAALSIRGLRKEGDPGSWYDMRTGPAAARTDVQGRARIDYVRWVDIDGRTTDVDLEVEHAEFVPFRDSSFAIGEGQHQVTLRRGVAVVVSGWVGSPDVVIDDVVVRVDDDADLAPSAWNRERDGRLSTTRLTPGAHLIWLTAESAEHGTLVSAIESFELAESDWMELHLELRPTETLRGRLDDAVPRPILDGHVALNLNRVAPGTHSSLDRDYEAPVSADGTFELAGLLPGNGQLIALCPGWVSQRTRVETAEQAGIHFSRPPTPAQIEAALVRAGDEAFQAQRVTVPGTVPLVVQMERTGTLDVLVRDPAGAPLAGARVTAWPNVHWVGVGSTIFPWRDWSTTTDALGHARIEDLPPNKALWFGVEAEALQMKKKHRDDSPEAAITAGKTTEFEITLEAE
jgi:hypothetical protein